MHQADTSTQTGRSNMLLRASCTNCDNDASQESNRGSLWSRAVTSDALSQVQCLNISSLSYFPWKYPWYMWESVDNVLDRCMSVPANWSFISSQSCDMSIAKAAWHPWVSPLYQVLELTCNNHGVWHGEVFHYRATIKMLIGMLKW